ncbi:MAG: GNAT family N-acetyltransferase [Euryarchaeota archaeon]|nr:GNAT family N-acetyltransferase [Euryarchaeota archaeon]
MTPELEFRSDMKLVPVRKAILPLLLEAYNEDPEAAQKALPWLDASNNVQGQLSDMLFDVENQSEVDRLHFWWIRSEEKGNFVGLIGLGDELQLLQSSYNLGYWVRSSYQRQGIALEATRRVLHWLENKTIENDGFIRIEITVHPHNEAGLATASRICEEWGGEIIEQFIGIEIGQRTVPHRMHILDLPRGEVA